MKKTIIWIVGIAVIAVGGWYAFERGSLHQKAVAAPVAQQAAQPRRPLLSVASSTKLGTYLVGATGMTLYTFKKDTPNVSNCSGACATLWPPYVVTSTSSLPVASNVTGKVGAITRAGGGIQLTYNGKPLYFFQKDTKPGETSGEGFKGLWLVAKP